MSKTIRNLILIVAVSSVAGCMVGEEEQPVEEGAGNENALAIREVANEGEVLRVTASLLNLRSGGSTSASIIGSLRSGELVTTATTSGATGWVNVRTAGGRTGWAYGTYLAREAPTTTTTGDGETCAAARGQGAVSKYQKALHDAIAYAEGTRNQAKDGYNVLFSYQLATSCTNHPNKCIAFGNTCSTAAGRYQFLNNTWRSVKAARSLPSFEPENQERGAAYLIWVTRRVSVPQDRAMTAAEFENAMSKLSYEWASLPPGRYGQPSKTASQMRSTYCSFAGC